MREGGEKMVVSGRGRVTVLWGLWVVKHNWEHIHKALKQIKWLEKAVYGEKRGGKKGVSLTRRLSFSTSLPLSMTLLLITASVSSMESSCLTLASRFEIPWHSLFIWWAKMQFLAVLIWFYVEEGWGSAFLQPRTKSCHCRCRKGRTLLSQVGDRRIAMLQVGWSANG